MTLPMTRAECLRLAGMTTAVPTGKSLALSPKGSTDKREREAIVSMLYGSPRPETDLDAWFRAIEAAVQKRDAGTGIHAYIETNCVYS